MADLKGSIFLADLRVQIASRADHVETLSASVYHWCLKKFLAKKYINRKRDNQE